MTTAHQAYNLYMTTKKHFTNSKYSAFADKPVRIPNSRFMYRPERYRMERLCKRFKTPKELIQYFVANFALETSDFLYQPEEYGDSSYLRWEAYKQSMTYLFESDVRFIQDYCDSRNVKFQDCILTLMVTDKISIQTLVILDSFYNFLTPMSESDKLNSLFAPHVLRAQKTKDFIKFDKDLLQNIARGLEEKDYEYAQAL